MTRFCWITGREIGERLRGRPQKRCPNQALMIVIRRQNPDRNTPRPEKHRNAKRRARTPRFIWMSGAYPVSDW